jgi:hypothetical protein
MDRIDMSVLLQCGQRRAKRPMLPLRSKKHEAAEASIGGFAMSTIIA